VIVQVAAPWQDREPGAKYPSSLLSRIALIRLLIDQQDNKTPAPRLAQVPAKLLERRVRGRNCWLEAEVCPYVTAVDFTQCGTPSPSDRPGGSSAFPDLREPIWPKSRPEPLGVVVDPTCR